MNTQVLIDSIVRQTTVLIAALATKRGLRAPVAQIADQVFLELARELEAQGVSRQVSADMFGIALRSYRRRIQRLSESCTEQGRSLWEAVLDYLSSGVVRTRADVVKRFRRDDEASLRAILVDLCESGLVFRSGRGGSAAYRAATESELREMRRDGGGLEEILWVLIYREGPLALSVLADRVRAERPVLEAVLEGLLASGRVTRGEDGAYRASRVVLMADEASGWQAALFDHYQALVRTMCVRLRNEGPSEGVGGSTYTFDIWDGHPLAEEVRGTLSRLRRELGELWERVERHNQGKLPECFEQVIVYAGQSSQKEES